MTKKIAERPCLIHLQSEAFDDDTLCSLKLNANDVAEWEIGECIPELGASIFQVTFKGHPIQEDGTLTCLGSLLYDACDYGLEIHQLIGDALYEARHPWLDYEDAVKRGAFKEKAQYLYLLTNKEDENLDVTWVYLQAGLMRLESYQAKSAKVLAVKPVDKVDFYHFNQVKVWEMNT